MYLVYQKKGITKLCDVTYLSPSLQFGHVHATRRILALGVPSAVDSLLTADDTVP
jgi:hypothetical protein